jgi:hypothetical protein
MDELEVRGFLGGFLFRGDEVFRTVGTLSGGERTRLALARIVWSAPNLSSSTAHQPSVASREALERRSRVRGRSSWCLAGVPRCADASPWLEAGTASVPGALRRGRRMRERRSAGGNRGRADRPLRGGRAPRSKERVRDRPSGTARSRRQRDRLGSVGPSRARVLKLTAAGEDPGAPRAPLRDARGRAAADALFNERMISDGGARAAPSPRPPGGSIETSLRSLTVSIGSRAETATTVLPSFLPRSAPRPSRSGRSGVADATASFVKLGAGWWSDRIGAEALRRGLPHPRLSTSVFAAAFWITILAARSVSWLSRGARGPARRHLTDSIPAEARGRAFRFIGPPTPAAPFPLLAAWLLPALIASRRTADAAVSLGLPRVGRAGLLRARGLALRDRACPSAGGAPHLLAAVSASQAVRVPRGRRPLWCGRLRPHTLDPRRRARLTPTHGAWGGVDRALPAVHNVAYALTPFPVGWLSDRVGRRGCSPPATPSGPRWRSPRVVFHQQVPADRRLVFLFAYGPWSGSRTRWRAPRPPTRRHARSGRRSASWVVNRVGDLVSGLDRRRPVARESARRLRSAAVMMAGGAVVVARFR